MDRNSHFRPEKIQKSGKYMRQKEYLTVSAAGRGEYTEKKSRFLGEIHPAASEQEAVEILSGIRKQYYDARHHCYSWILGEDGMQKKAADDGEPSGTAGVPMLKVLEGAGLRNVIVVVTRYFGGTLLGTGGLVRAYTSAAQAALENAKASGNLVRMCSGRVAAITVEYPVLDKLFYYLRQEKIEPYDQSYTDKVTMKITIRENNADSLLQDITVLTNGTAQVQTVEKVFFPLPVKA